MNYRPYRTVLWYFSISIIWIIGTGLLLQYVDSVSSISNLMFFEILKGLFFVLSTSIILFFLLRRQQSNLVSSERQYRQLFESNPSPMWVYNLESLRFVEVNESAVRKYGYSHEEFLTMTILDVRPSQDRERLLTFLREEKTNNKSSGIWKHLKKSGEEILVSIRAFPIKFNGQACAMVLAVDVTEKVNQQKQLELSYRKEIELNDALAAHIELIRKSNEENRRMGEIIDKINNFVIITDKEGNFKWANKAFLNFSGYSANEILGKNRIELLSGPSSDLVTLQSLQHAMSSQNYFASEILNYTKDKQWYWTQLTITPIYDENTNLEGFISIENVITERKIREERIQHQNQTLRQLAWLNSHEIRRPITSILALIEIIQELEESAEKQECFRLLQECSMELDAVVKDIAKRVNLAENNDPSL